MDLGPLFVVGALIVGLLAGERSGIAAANGALIVGVGALGASWFARRPWRGVLVAAACALLGFAVMGRALDGQARSPFAAMIDRRADTTVHGVATSDPDGPTYEASVLVRVDAGAGTHRTLLVDASGDDVAALRVIEAGDHVVLAGRLEPLGTGAYADRARWRHAVGRLEGTRVLALTAPGGLLAIANTIRTEILRGTRPLAPTTRALVAGFLLGGTAASLRRSSTRTATPACRICSRSRERTSRSSWRWPRRCSGGSDWGHAPRPRSRSLWCSRR